MARVMKNRVLHFGLENSDAIDENERILEVGRQQRKENREKKENEAAAASGSSAETPTSVKSSTTTTPSAETPTDTTSVANHPTTPSFSYDSMRKSKGKKTENGITIYVPMKYYERITLMKMRTGVPIRDLALQAVIEFLDRNK